MSGACDLPEEGRTKVEIENLKRSESENADL
jgi:hypothetical protein